MNAKIKQVGDNTNLGQLSGDNSKLAQLSGDNTNMGQFIFNGSGTAHFLRQQCDTITATRWCCHQRKFTNQNYHP